MFTYRPELMLSRNYALPARAQFVTLLILALSCITEAAHDHSPISTSSDVWAMLVANVAPLLVLIGERHVKAYFKIMCRPSHHLLFASAPIGLVTAITTLIRLDGIPLFKRLIGRQFETRAEVLADVTSISGGEVGLVLQNMNLEQTIQPTDEDLAMFWVHGRTKGSPEEAKETFSAWNEVLISIGKSVTESPSFYYDRRCSWEIIMSFKATGTCAQWVARKHAAESRNLRELLDRCEKEVAAEENSGSIATCTASAGVYARFTDVSLDITASTNYDKGKLEIMRYATIAFCLMGNIGIIIASKLTGATVFETLLVGFGLVGSSFGCWLTARAVDLMSKEIVIDTSGLSTIASGFFSHRTPGGAKLSICPPKIAFSSVSQRGLRLGRFMERLAKMWHLVENFTGVWHFVGAAHIMEMERFVELACFMQESPTVIVTPYVVASYLALYVGLRSCNWWVSAAMLGNSAIAAIARSVLVPSDPYLVEADSRLPNPMTCRIGDPTNREDLSHPDESNCYSPDTDAGSASDRGTRALDVGHKMQPYMWAAFALATEMSKRQIAPLEVRDFPPRSAGIIGVEGAACIFSDIITRKGVWRQPLEVIVYHGGQSVPERILAVFWGWYWRASAHQAQKVASIELPPDLLNRFIDLDDDDGDDDGDDDAKFGTPADKLKEVLDSSTTPREIVWMGAKLCYASYHHWECHMFEAERDSWFSSNAHGYLEQGQISPFLDAIVAAGLTFPRG